MKKEIKMRIKRKIHGKLGDVSAKLNFDSDSESVQSDRYDTENMGKHSNFDGGMALFDKTTVQFLYTLYFHINILKSVLVFIPCFDAKMFAMKNKVYNTPPNPR